MKLKHASLRFALLSAAMVAVAEAAGAQPPAPAKDWFAGAWRIDPAALAILPEGRTVASPDGAELLECKLSFAGRILVKVEPDLNVYAIQQGQTTAPKLVPERGGGVAGDDRSASLSYECRWKSADGQTSTAVFVATGKLIAKGQFSQDALELELQWTADEPVSLILNGRSVTDPGGIRTLKSAWTLKPEMSSPTDFPQEKPTLVLHGRRTESLDAGVPGCPALPVMQRIMIDPAPAADLDVSVGAPAAGVAQAGEKSRRITVRNLGPSKASGIVLRVVPPEHLGVTLSGEARVDQATGILTLPIAALAPDAASEVDLSWIESAAPSSDALAHVLVHVATSDYDPRPENNRVLIPTAP
jgi:hypothetical protein